MLRLNDGLRCHHERADKITYLRYVVFGSIIR